MTCIHTYTHTYTQGVEPKELEDTLRLEYRSKLLNPAWANAMVAQGAGGAYEVRDDAILS